MLDFDEVTNAHVGNDAQRTLKIMNGILHFNATNFLILIRRVQKLLNISIQITFATLILASIP